MLFTFLQSFAQQRTITGQVTDSSGAPLSDASVVVVGQKSGVRTDASGNFTLNVSPTAKQLRVSYVGSETQTVNIGSQSAVNVTMISSSQSLSDVVVVGYGTARKKDLTGAVASVQSKDFNKGTYTAPDQLIQGKAAGVLVINNTGQPGGSTTVRIRGSSSIRSGNQPLFVVDGVPLSGGSARPGGSGGEFGSDGGNPLNYLNPNDIASIEILKDASATAIFGSRGANGVILISTKKGKSGAPTLDVSTSTSVSNVAKKLKVLDGNAYRNALKDYNQTSGDFGSNVDAFDAITRTGSAQNYNVAVGGGTENGRYRLSLGYLDQAGIVKSSDFQKYSANFSTNFKFLESKKLGLDINIFATQTNENIAPISAFVGFTGNLISQALQWNPTQPLYKAGTDSPTVVGGTTINPVAQLRYYEDRAKVSTIVASISPSYKITNDLEYKFLYSVNRQVGNRKGQINKLLNLQGVEGRGLGYMSYLEQTNTQLTNTLSYNKQVVSAVNLNAVIGHEWLIFDRLGNSLSGQDFANNGKKYYDQLFAVPQASRNVSSFRAPSSELQSFFARAIVNISDKYLITGTIRADGSTKFGTNNKYGYFPSVGVAWNVSKESFLADSKDINTLKLRASYGTTGNQEFPSGASLPRFSISSTGINQVNFGNPDLRWESSKTTNFGIDFGLLNSRLTGSVDYFYKKTTNVLFESTPALPSPNGTKVWINLDGSVINKGVEVSLLGNVINKKDFTWNIGGNVSFLSNTVNGLTGFYETGDLRGQGFSNVRGQRVISGQPLNVWYLRRFEGIDKSTGQSIYTDGGNTLFYSGSPNPKTLVGLSTDMTYKKFTATVNMNGTFGHYIFNNTAASVLGIGNLGTRNVAKSVFNGGEKEAISNAPAPSTRNLEKGNYLKMANASLGYRVGNLGKSIRNLYISVTGQNLFVITKYTGFDPEVNTDGGVDGIPSLGIEYIPYPSARTIQIGLSFSLQ